MLITLLTGKTSKLKEKIQDELGLDMKVSRNSRARKMTLKIDSKSHTPTLTIPNLCSNKSAFAFVEKHLDWIEKKLSEEPNSKQFEDGETISLFGNILTIRHCPNLRGTTIKGEELCVSGDISFLHRRVKDYIKKQAKAEFYKRSLVIAKQLGCKLNVVLIKDTKSRWGSCSSNNNINYNWRIALAPAFVIDYLICHEVSHLKHQDHSRDFWNCVKGLYPDYLKGQAWLKSKGKELNIYE